MLITIDMFSLKKSIATSQWQIVAVVIDTRYDLSLDAVIEIDNMLFRNPLLLFKCV